MENVIFLHVKKYDLISLYIYFLCTYLYIYIYRFIYISPDQFSIVARVFECCGAQIQTIIEVISYL